MVWACSWLLGVQLTPPAGVPAGERVRFGTLEGVQDAADSPNRYVCLCCGFSFALNMKASTNACARIWCTTQSQLCNAPPRTPVYLVARLLWETISVEFVR